MQTYNGHRSWNAWNVSLWINNDENLYNYACNTVKSVKGNIARAARIMFQDLRGSKTPDGAKYSLLAIREAIRDIND
jgi:hypothetical protein